VQLLLDGAIRLNAARVGGIIRSVAARFDPGSRGNARAPVAHPASSTRGRFWFNATLRDRNFFLATIAGMLLTNPACRSRAWAWWPSASAPFGKAFAADHAARDRAALLPYVAVSCGVLTFAVLGAGLIFGVWPVGSYFAMAALTPVRAPRRSRSACSFRVAKTSAQPPHHRLSIMPSFVLSGVMFVSADAQRRASDRRAPPLRWYQMAARGCRAAAVWGHPRSDPGAVRDLRRAVAARSAGGSPRLMSPRCDYAGNSFA
jgi:hypothetical protein